MRKDDWISAYNFTLGSVGAKEGYGISAYRLAQHFRHASPDSQTEIAHAVVNTKVYSLVCRGKVHVTRQKCANIPEDGLEVFDSRAGFSEEALRLLEDEATLASMTVIEQPEFVWLNELCMPVKAGTDVISTDPQMELRLLTWDLQLNRP